MLREHALSVNMLMVPEPALIDIDPAIHVRERARSCWIE